MKINESQSKGNIGKETFSVDKFLCCLATSFNFSLLARIKGGRMRSPRVITNLDLCKVSKPFLAFVFVDVRRYLGLRQIELERQVTQHRLGCITASRRSTRTSTHCRFESKRVKSISRKRMRRIMRTQRQQKRNLRENVFFVF